MSTLTISQIETIESALNSAGLGILAVDKSGEIKFSNSAAISLLGLETTQIGPEDWPEHYGIYLPGGTEHCPIETSPIIRAMSGEETDNIEFFISNNIGAGRSLACLMNLRPLKNEQGETMGGVLLIQDISERKRLQDEVIRSNSALQQFATVAAHDLQEPLRSVSGFADMLAQFQKDNLDEKSQRCISKIKDGVVRMQTLINALLNFSRIQTKPQSLGQIDCNKIVKICIRDLAASIEAKDAQIKFDNLPIVMADHSQLLQLFQNLIGNALKFSASDRSSEIDISAKQQGLFWKFSIRDNGIGIEKEFQKRIFGVFQRLHTTAAYPGTGIGLAVCQNVVERHGGQIWIESALGTGSTFHFTIPVSREVNQ